MNSNWNDGTCLEFMFVKLYMCISCDMGKIDMTFGLYSDIEYFWHYGFIVASNFLYDIVPSVHWQHHRRNLSTCYCSQNFICYSLFSQMEEDEVFQQDSALSHLATFLCKCSEWKISRLLSGDQLGTHRLNFFKIHKKCRLKFLS